MKWVAYLGPSPSRDVPGVGVMEREVPALVKDEVAEALLASPQFGEFTPPEPPASTSPAGTEGD